MLLGNIQKMEDLVDLVNEIGFLPMFSNSLPGYSVEECTPSELMFEGKAEGPWKWREELFDQCQKDKKRRSPCVFHSAMGGRLF